MKLSRLPRGSAAIGSVALATVLATAALLVPADTARAADPAGWKLTWSDEFNSAAGTGVDATKWKHDVGGGGWGNSQLEYDTDGTQNAAMDGQGNLVLTARKGSGGYTCWNGTCQYTSARLNTSGHFSQKYGRLESRIQIPCGQGMWPAFWALGNNIGSSPWPASGEIDVMENVGKEPGTVHGSLHGPGYSGGSAITGQTSIGGRLCDGFHTYSADWSPSAISFALDGTVYKTATPASANGNTWAFDHDFFLLLNLAVGGNWPGGPDAATAFPSAMKVDYVRVYSASGSTGTTPSSTPNPSGGSTTGTGQIVGLAGKCLDVNAAGTADGTQVQLYACNGTPAQRWTQSGDGTIKALGKCLDVNAAGTADGTKIQLWTCNGTPAQRWTQSSDGTIKALGKCLDVAGNVSTDRTPVHLWSCTGGANQKWAPPA